jgi:hypothetical protein
MLVVPRNGGSGVSFSGAERHDQTHRVSVRHAKGQGERDPVDFPQRTRQTRFIPEFQQSRSPVVTGARSALGSSSKVEEHGVLDILVPHAFRHWAKDLSTEHVTTAKKATIDRFVFHTSSPIPAHATTLASGSPLMTMPICSLLRIGLIICHLFGHTLLNPLIFPRPSTRTTRLPSVPTVSALGWTLPSSFPISADSPPCAASSRAHSPRTSRPSNPSSATITHQTISFL